MSREAEKRAPIAIIGLGNVLLGDDGFGPYVVELLRAQWEFPGCVALIDAGTPGLGLITHLDGREVLILVDAVGATGRPGELRRYSGEDLRTLPPKPRVSPHDPAVQEALWITELAGRGPRRVVLFGVIPASLDVGLQLSAPVRDATAATAALVVNELAACGATPVPRVNPPAPDAWWMRHAAG
jgi:hydrogenase maturation protease